MGRRSFIHGFTKFKERIHELKMSNNQFRKLFAPIRHRASASNQTSGLKKQFPSSNDCLALIFQ